MKRTIISNPTPDRSEKGFEIAEEFVVDGFDPIDNWNPTVQRRDSGMIVILFPEFPPDVVGDDMNDFDTLMSEQIGVKVYHEDRELFVITRPEPDTMAKLKEFFLKYEAD